MIKPLGCCLLMILFASFAFAGGAQRETLFSFASTHSYSDNRKLLKPTTVYNAHKVVGPVDNQVSMVLQAYPGEEGFKQVSIWCDRCDSNGLSKNQMQFCNDDFTKLVSTINDPHVSKKIASQLGLDPLVQEHYLKTVDQDFKVRVSRGVLKCDLKKGHRYRIDYFFKK